MSYDPTDYNGDNGRTHCTCGAQHRPAYKLLTCAHPGCEVRGCNECLAECGASKSCGRFCEEHLLPVEDLGPCCFRCTKEDIDQAELSEAA